jgi:hypothetical protein
MHHFAFNFQGNAVLSVLTFLGTGALLALCLLIAVVCFARKQPVMARRIGLTAAAIVAVYGVLLVGSSALSKEIVLSPHDEKYFCEVDCHLAYSVQGVQHARTLGPPEKSVTARGEFCVVTLQTRFDETTISAHRPREMPLWPNPRYVQIQDERGRRFEVSLDGQQALDATLRDQAPLSRPLRPGESYTTQLVFDLPQDVQHPRLILSESDWPTRLLIGHENSLLHKRTYFAL